MVEVAERVELQPPVRAPQVNTHQAAERSTVDLSRAIEKLRRNIAMTTAGVSLAVAERPSGWLNNYVDDATLPSGSEWAVKAVDPRFSEFGERWTLPRSCWYFTVGPGNYVTDVRALESAGVERFEVEANVSSADVIGSTFAAPNMTGVFPGSPMQLVGGGSLPLAVRPVNISPLATLEQAKRAVRIARDDAREDVRRRLDATAAMYAQLPPRDVVEYLADEVGVGQLLTARAVGVTPTAVRKWRRGEAARPEHRTRLARFAALNKLLAELGPHDPAGWLDIPLSSESTLSPMDLYLAGRPDLVLIQGSRLAAPHETLDQFDVDWRSKYPVDIEYEVVTWRDGSRSAVPRRQE